MSITKILKKIPKPLIFKTFTVFQQENLGTLILNLISILIVKSKNSQSFLDDNKPLSV